MSAGQGETDQRLSFAKGVKAAHVVEALHAPVLVGMFGRLYNVRQSLSAHSWPIEYFTGT